MEELNKVLEGIKEREVRQGIETEILRGQLHDCVNELCYKCGNYHESYAGACDGCRWKKVKEGFQ